MTHSPTTGQRAVSLLSKTHEGCASYKVSPSNLTTKGLTLQFDNGNRSWYTRLVLKGVPLTATVARLKNKDQRFVEES